METHTGDTDSEDEVEDEADVNNNNDNDKNDNKSNNNTNNNDSNDNIPFTLNENGEKIFTCTECGKEMAHQGAFSNHMRSHKPKKQMVCEYCSKTFTQNY